MAIVISSLEILGIGEVTTIDESMLNDPFALKMIIKNTFSKTVYITVDVFLNGNKIDNVVTDSLLIGNGSRTLYSDQFSKSLLTLINNNLTVQVIAYDPIGGLPMSSDMRTITIKSEPLNPSIAIDDYP